MTPLTYQELIGSLFPRLTGGIRWGLERTARLLAEVGDPHLAYRTIHVGGTNGKGSVAAMIAAVLRCAGVRTGLYTSPHLCTFRERVQVDGIPVSEEQFVAAASRLWPHVERESPSFFEATTAIAFLALAEAGVEAAVVEVGLGGRLDATNVVRPDVVALTNVAVDHAQYLGDTLESIAYEKAGIIKPGVPVVTAEPAGAAREVFRRCAAEVAAPFAALEPGDVRAVRVRADGTRFLLPSSAWGELELCTPLIGPYQATNAALAVRALERLAPEWRPTRDAIEEGIRTVRWPGRAQIERVGAQTWVFDVAHNPAGVAALTATLEALALPRPVALLVGILGDKDWEGMLPPLAELADHTVLTIPPTAPPQRRWDPHAVLRAVPGLTAEVLPDFLAALERVADRAGPGGSVVVTGSFHTVGDALIALGRAPFGADAPLPEPTHAA
ncbi:MAG TPA: folylpolyglutamate synthase/dihydrofolate synthase family protein [Longimicrobiales bacterium]